MRWYQKMEISAKFSVSFILTALISGIAGYLGCKTIGDNTAVSIVAVMLFAAVLGLAVGRFTSKTVTEPVKEAQNVLERLAVNDCSLEVKGSYSGTMGKLSTQINDVRARLLNIQDVFVRVSKGDTGRLAEMKKIGRRSENDKLMPSMIDMMEAIQGLMQEVSMLSDSASKGDLDVRGNAGKFEGGYKGIIEGFNKTLDIIIEPINEAATVLGNMSLNDYSLDMRGRYNGTLAQFAEKINLVRSRLLSVQDIAVRVSKGDVSRLEEFRKIGKRSENDRLIPSFKEMMETIQNLINEVEMLMKAAAGGDLEVRGNAAKFEGGYKVIIEGFNETLDLIAKPLNEATGVLGKISVNDISVSMTGKYNGVFGNLAAQINGVHTRLSSILDSFTRISKGDISRLEEAKRIGKRSENDKLVPSMIDMMEAIQELVQEVGMLSDSALKGNLSVRGNTGKFSGVYRDVIEGFNKTLDTIIEPINEASTVLGNMSLNDYSLEMKGEYSGVLAQFAEKINLVRSRLLSVQDIAVRVSKGDVSRLEEFRKIGKRSENDRLVPSFREMMEAIQNLIDEVEMLTKAAAGGSLDIRGNTAKFEGGYKTVIEGVNGTLDAIARPLQEVNKVLGKMVENDYTNNISGRYEGAFRELTDAINGVQDTLSQTLGEINKAAYQVAAGARQVSDSSQALSQGSTEQASAIEELTASMEEISSQTKHNAVNAGQANELSITAKSDAIHGNEQMKEMLKSMQEINEASGNISKIIKVIDEIAFQTNILALNAAVEAARAGQHGKGFAVVAEEVRNLAARSANAAKETTGLIESSIRKVENGTSIANATANALNQIVDGVSKAAALVGDIATASNEQASGISQVNQGIMQVSQVVQTNSATSEESAAASEELSGQAELLKEMVGKFKLRKGSSSHNYTGFDEANSDFEYAGNNKRNISRDKNGAVSAVGVPKKKIVLSDTEFDKY